MKISGLITIISAVYGCITLDSHWYRERIKMQLWRSRQEIQSAISRIQSKVSIPEEHVNKLLYSCTQAIHSIEAELVLFNILLPDHADPENPFIKK